MIQKDANYNYIHGSAARKLEYDVYEQNKVLRAKKQYKDNNRVKLKTVLSILLVFAAGLLLMYRFGTVMQMNYKIAEFEKEYNRIRSENSQIKVQIENETDLTSIKEIAEKRLGMQKPDKSQYVYIRVPRNDYTIVSNIKADQEAEDGGIFAGVFDKLAGVIQ